MEHTKKCIEGNTECKCWIKGELNMCKDDKKHVPHSDSINYHDVVALVESLRPVNPKMVVVHDDVIVEKVLNKMRNGLRKLKKGESII